jgi:hypothetical protein
MLLITTGGSLSLGPPEGALIFAQALIRIKSADIRKKRASMLLFINSSGYL